jgi:hypothetical protein
VRWFSRGAVPEDVREWFVSDFPYLEVQPPRVDVYFPLLTDDWVGIKLRERRIEIKQRYGDLGTMALSTGVVGVPELWRKWALGFVAYGGGPGELDGWISVQKTRLVRNYAFLPGVETPRAVPGTFAPARGCSMELTEVEVNGTAWWTAGFEATGAESELALTLEVVARHVLSGNDKLRLGLDASYGYPRWLQEALA